MLQRELPKKESEKILNELFEKYVTNNEKSFSKKLYLNFDDINEMKDDGMYFGAHTFSHKWLTSLTHIELEKEINK